MSDETESRSDSPQTPAPESNGPTPAKARPALLYIGVMFAVAMLLLLMSFLMQQRNHEALMESVGSVQAMADLQLENQRLTQKVADLEEALALAKDETDLTAERELRGHQVEALYWLLEIRHLYDTGDMETAAQRLLTLSINGYLVDNLPTFDIINPDMPSAQAIYDELKAALYPDGLPVEVTTTPNE